MHLIILWFSTLSDTALYTFKVIKVHVYTKQHRSDNVFSISLGMIITMTLLTIMIYKDILDRIVNKYVKESIF